MRTAIFEGFEIELQEEEYVDMSSQGACDNAVLQALTLDYILDQLDNIDPDLIRKHLWESGAYDDEELKDDEQNRHRILWFAACDIRDEIHQEEDGE